MPGPLSGLKVLDFTTLLPGPYATMILSDLGADVLRVISGTRPDLVVHIPPLITEAGFSAAYAYLGRGKRCMTLNLKDRRAKTIIHKLISSYDIIIEQFRPGVMAKLGLDYESLKEVNPSIIYCSITGYGQNSPLHDRAGHDINYLALSGIMNYSGRRHTGPTLLGIQIADIAAGSHNAVMGILAAVICRNQTGKGQYIDISMTDGLIALNAITAAGLLVDGLEPEREGTLLNGGSLYDFYETKDGKYIAVGSLEPQFFKVFCEIIECPDLVTGGVDPQNLEEVKERIKNIIKSKTQDEWVSLYQEVDACVEPVLSLFEALNNEHARQRSIVVDISTPKGQVVKQPACPIKFSETPPEYRYIAAPAGMNTKEVLLEFDYTEEDYEELSKTGLFN